jgi:hypothetical protein
VIYRDLASNGVRQQRTGRVFVVKRVVLALTWLPCLLGSSLMGEKALDESRNVNDQGGGSAFSGILGEKDEGKAQKAVALSVPLLMGVP